MFAIPTRSGIEITMAMTRGAAKNLYRIATHGIERVDLLGHLHGSELRCDAGADAADHDDRRQNRAHLQNHAFDHDRSHDVKRQIALHLIAALLTGHDSDQPSCDENDGHALYPQDPNLAKNNATGDAKSEHGDAHFPDEPPELTGMLGDSAERPTDAYEHPVEELGQPRKDRKLATHSAPRMEMSGHSAHEGGAKRSTFFW